MRTPECRSPRPAPPATGPTETAPRLRIFRGSRGSITTTCSRPCATTNRARARIRSWAGRSAASPRRTWPISRRSIRAKEARCTSFAEASPPSGFRFFPIFAQVPDDARRALGFSRLAHVAPVQDQPVVRVLAEALGDELEKFVLDLAHILARCEAGAVGDAKDVRVHRDGRMAEGGVEDHVGGLPADSRERFERFARLRHLSAVALDEQPAGFEDVLRLGAIQADRADVFDQSLHAEGEQ